MQAKAVGLHGVSTQRKYYRAWTRSFDVGIGVHVHPLFIWAKIELALRTKSAFRWV